MAVETGTDSSERLTYTVEEAAAAIGVSERHLRTAIAAGQFPAARLGKRILVARSQVEAWLAQRAVAV